MLKRVGSLAVVCLCLFFGMPSGAGAADDNAASGKNDNPYIRNVEVGFEQGSYTGGLGKSNAQFIRASAWRQKSHTLRADLGRAKRFNETSYGLGLSYTRHLPSKTDVTLGVSSGTGDILAPEYRIDFGVQQAVLAKKNLLLSGGYTRVQSKEENASDGYTAGALLYHGHWLFGADYHYDIGHPGDTVSSSWQVGLTWYIYQRTYIGGTYRDGDVSYMLVGLGDALVDYESESWTFGVSQWFWAKSGINLRYSHETTSFYKMDSVSVSFFKGF